MGECGPREGFSTDMVMGYPGTGNSHADWAELFLENRRLKAKT